MPCGHLLPPWERTYFAQHGKPCPFQVGNPAGRAARLQSTQRKKKEAKQCQK